MKYTVVVADDEEEIRRSLVRRVKWEEIGFEVVGEAENGADALELVEKLEPDLLLTDIKMPFLSGIELARAVREVRPMVQIAFLSGFDDFTYAQQAIQYNIVSYMLKPISAKEIEAELIKIKKAMDQRVEEFTKERKEKLDIRKTQFLIPLLLDSFQNERVSEEALLERAEECELIRNPKPDNMQYVVLVTGIRDANGKDQTSYSSVNAVDMILKKYVHYVSCHLEGRVVSLIATTPGGMGKYLHIIVEEIVQSVERIMGYCCQVGVSRSVNTLGKCRESYLEAMNALSYSRKDKSSVYFISDAEHGSGLEQGEIQEITATMENFLRGGMAEDLEIYLDDLEKKLRNGGKNTLVLSTILLTEIGAAVYKVIYMAIGECGVEVLQKKYSMQQMREMERMAENFQIIKMLCMEAKKMLMDQRKKSSEVICEQAVQIIQDRYAQQDLSVMIISEEIGVSPNYLSSLIKKTTGSSLVEILTGDGLGEGKEGSTNSVIEKKKVVFLTKSMDSSFWQSAYAGAGAASAEYNLDLVCEGPDGDGEEDYEAQNEMIDRAIREQVDALLFSAIDFEKNAEAIDRAAKAGIRIVVVDSPVNSEAVECYIGTDNYEAGCMAGEEVLGNPAENLNIGIVNFDKSTENGQLREKGFRDTVLNDDRANITASINVKSTITDAREGTERMLLDNPQINVIVTFNEWTTLGVGDAVEALGAGERTQVVAFDSNVKSIGMLEKGNVDALIVQNPYAMGYLGIEQINTLLNGQKPEKKETATSSILVTRENMYDDKSQKALFSFEEK